MSVWRLEDFRVSRIRYGKDEGKYSGKVEFKNNKGDEFVLALNQEDSNILLRLMTNQIHKTANELVEKLLSSIDEQVEVSDE